MSQNDGTPSDSYSTDPGNNRKNFSRKRQQRAQHFKVSSMVHCELDFDFAITLGQLLLDVETDDKRFKSFGHHLCNLEESDQS